MMQDRTRYYTPPAQPGGGNLSGPCARTRESNSAPWLKASGRRAGASTRPKSRQLARSGGPGAIRRLLVTPNHQAAPADGSCARLHVAPPAAGPHPRPARSSFSPSPTPRPCRASEDARLHWLSFRDEPARGSTNPVPDARERVAARWKGSSRGAGRSVRNVQAKTGGVAAGDGWRARRRGRRPGR